MCLKVKDKRWTMFKFFPSHLYFLLFLIRNIGSKNFGSLQKNSNGNKIAHEQLIKHMVGYVC